jgi:hypothetical protein
MPHFQSYPPVSSRCGKPPKFIPGKHRTKCSKFY